MVALNKVVLTEISRVLSTHLAFYRRHPWLMALFLLGFSLGSALLTAITGLNQEAKNRYQNSSALISNPVTHLVKPLVGQQYLSGELWLKLRAQGFINSQPVLRGRLTTQSGQTLSIQGVDSLLWLNNQASKSLKQGQNKNSATKQLAQPAQPASSSFNLAHIFVDQQFAKRLQVKSDDTASESNQPDSLGAVFKFDSAKVAPQITFVENLGLWAITDLAYADYLLNAKVQLSFIELTNVSAEQLEQLKTLLAGEAQLVDAEQQEFDVLSGAFFFNLTALAMLGYIVAAFLSFNAIKLTLAGRKKLLYQMHLLGCRRSSIQIALAIELAIVSLLTALIGSFGGYLIANGLVLDVNRILIGLYELDKALVVHWQWYNVLLGLVLNIAALLVILLAQFKHTKRYRNLAFGLAIVGNFAAMLWLLCFAESPFQALLLCFTLLVGFILIVPKLLTGLASLSFNFRSPLSEWLFADMRSHLKELNIAVIAILVALGSAIGMQIMVTSFGQTLTDHLEKQLSADIYLRTHSLDQELRRQLSDQTEVKKLSVYLQSDGHVELLDLTKAAIPANLASFGPDASHYQHISMVSGDAVSEQHFDNQGCLANEQTQIKYGVALGDNMDFIQNDQVFSCRISGFFYDYRNPKVSLLTLESRQYQANLHWKNFGYAIRLHQGVSLAEFSERLVDEFAQDTTAVLPNKRFKQYANKLFDDTFVVTKALNGFILAIALVSLATSLLSISANQIKQLTILRNLGVNQRQLLTIKLTQTTLIVVFTVICALPLGLTLGLSLLKFVMPIAFGWTIHFSLALGEMLQMSLILIAVSIVCAYWPVRRLTSN